MLRKLLLPLSLLLIVAMLAGCAAQPAAAPAPAEPAPAEPAPAEPAPAEPAPAEPAPAEPAAGAVEELNILWAQWDPADFLQQLVADYETETGIKVNVIQEPWGTFGDRFFTEMAAGGDAWDMVIGDSQWLGQSTTANYYVDMTEFLNSTGIKDTVTPATLTYYGEYPAGSGTYWAYPTEGDANGWSYRKDLFEDPKEMEAFKAEYGYDLAVPTTYEQFMDIAKFFTRPDQGLYGVAAYTQKDYDGMTMGVENAMFPYGGEWFGPGYQVMGVVNSPENVAAVQFYKDLYDCCQAPGLSNAFFTETNDAMISGQVAMSMNYFAFFPALVNPGTNPDYADKMGFFANPAGPTGDRGAGLGGQGMSIISFISPERQQASMDFIKWFAQQDVQAKWAELGGYTCNSEVLKSDTFLNANPYNPAFAETMTFVKDFFNIPPYGQLLEISQRELGKFVVEGQGTAQETMDTIATEYDKVLKETGFITQ